VLCADRRVRVAVASRGWNRHHDVSLTTGWHLNHARVSIPPVPKLGPKLTMEIRHHVRNLPEALCLERKFHNEQF
jgi:hypothetical protein